MDSRKELEALEQEILAPYAAKSVETRGRQYPVEPCRIRTDYQRDRDRVIHSSAFRKLEYKTQVYVIHEGDYYRTRLTHTMEVAQVARTMARHLRLNQDLAEAVSLAHDVGHTPFGHGGEKALHQLMADYGGFEHNRQGLRVVEKLEQRYEEFPGLNLSWEVREGIAKHRSSYDSPVTDEAYAPGEQASLEAQLVNVADEIAYHHHDLDDALKMELIHREDLKELDWLDAVCREIEKDGPDVSRSAPKRFRLVGRLLDEAIRDTLTHIGQRIEEAGVKSLEDVRNHPEPIIQFSPAMATRTTELSGFLMRRVYRHPHVVRMVNKGERIIEALFQLYLANPGHLPFHFQERILKDGPHRVISDYVSGMTDRYCLEEYRRSFLP